MRLISTIALCFITAFAFAQEKGVNFQNNLTWAQVKEKAKKENKYIFVDCYTTWCVPCKVMAKEVLPQPEVSSFLNDKFISVALQFDKTKQDDGTTKRWHNEVKRIEAEAKVNAYPSYLIYSPEGRLVHTIVGGSPDAKSFLAKLQEGLDPKMQLINLRKQYAAGNRTPAFLHTFARTLMQSWDPQTNEVLNLYLATQKDLLTKENAQFIMIATGRSTDPGFKVLLNNQAEFDKQTSPGLGRMIACGIMFDEIVLPFERTNGKKETKGGMVFYTGEINKNVDWNGAYAKLKAAYPNYADEVLIESKVKYYRDLNDWPKYAEQAAVYTKKYGNNHQQVMTYANDIMLFADDKASLMQAADWAKPIATADVVNNNWYIDVYARLLYKLGQKEQAITIVNNGVTKLGDKAYGLKDTQEKMKKGKL
jgi:thioredoxin-related protein